MIVIVDGYCILVKYKKLGNFISVLKLLLLMLFFLIYWIIKCLDWGIMELDDFRCFNYKVFGFIEDY